MGGWSRYLSGVLFPRGKGITRRVASLLLLATVVLAVVIGGVFRVGSDLVGSINERITATAAIISGIFAIISYFGRVWKQPTVPTGGQVTEAAEYVARLADIGYRNSVNDKALHGREPLVVRWRQYIGEHADPAMNRKVRSGQTGSVESLALYLQQWRRLVILGPGESGKSTLALLLARRLLQDRRRQPEIPVPLIVQATSWRPGEGIMDWLERHVREQYQELRDSSRYGANASRYLLEEHRILPVIDGVDEMGQASRELMLRQFGEVFSYDDPLVVICRSGEYHDAVAATGKVLPGAAIIELQPVSAKDAIRFLERSTAGPRSPEWRPVTEALRGDPQAPLARRWPAL